MSINKLPLHGVHKSLGASFGEAGQWLVPESYGDEAGEYDAVRKNVGIADLSSRGKLRLSGKEHLKFLQGMLTNDVMKLAPGKGMYAAILTVKGRMVADMHVYREEDAVFLDLETGLNTKVGDLLKKFRLSYKADIEDLTGQLGLLSVHGPKSGNLLKSLLGKDISTMAEYDHFRAEAGGTRIMAVKINRTGEQGYDLYVPPNRLGYIWDMLIEKGGEYEIKAVGSRVLRILRVEAGIPVYGIDMDEDTIPIEAGLWDALNFEKGCYVGQEVVARIKWRGHVNRHLMGFVMEGDDLPVRGDGIFHGEKKIGSVTSSIFSPSLSRPVALGYIRREFKEPGTGVSIIAEDGVLQRAIVSDLPFYKGSSGIQTD